MDTSFANYTNPGTSDVILPWWMSTPDCVWATPCYDQFTTSYNWETCDVWCWPVAAAIVLGYYNNNWFPNLIAWGTHNTNKNNYFVNNMIKELWILMKTWCNENIWVTKSSMYPILANYAKNKWYSLLSSNLYFNLTTTEVFNRVKSEINSWRPIIINVEASNWEIWHSVVWFGYKSTWNARIVRVNLWYWWEDSYYWYYYWSNIDQNLDSVYYNWSGGNVAREVLEVIISN